MNEIITWAEIFMNSLEAFAKKFSEAIPQIIGAILIFFIGWLIAKLFSFLLSKLLKAVKFDSLANKINAAEYLQKANISISPSKLLSKFVYWFIMLLVLISASETLGWEAVSTEISKLISYLPKLLIAVVIFILGTYLASFIRDVIAGATSSLGIAAGKLVSAFVFYLLIIMVTLTALDQAGIDTSIITSNLLLILGAILGSAAISYGFASRNVLSNILAGYVGRNTYKKGMKIEIMGVKGIIEDINSLGLTIQTENEEKVIIPTKEILSNQVRIFNS